MCRRRAFTRCRLPQRYYDPEDLAHESWIEWTRYRHMHPYVVVDSMEVRLWQWIRAKKRILPRHVSMVADDDPLGTLCVTDLMATVLEESIRSSRGHRKNDFAQAAQLLWQGYHPREVASLISDDDHHFSQNVRARMMRRWRSIDEETWRMMQRDVNSKMPGMSDSTLTRRRTMMGRLKARRRRAT